MGCPPFSGIHGYPLGRFLPGLCYGLPQVRFPSIHAWLFAGACYLLALLRRIGPFPVRFSSQNVGLWPGGTSEDLVLRTGDKSECYYPRGGGVEGSPEACPMVRGRLDNDGVVLPCEEISLKEWWGVSDSCSQGSLDSVSVSARLPL